MLKSKNWFRGKNTTVYLKGKEVHDYVSEAIERFLKNPSQYDEKKSSLLKYFEYYIIRSLISNDIRSSENRSTQDVFLVPSQKDENNDSNYWDYVLPYIDMFFDQQLDYDLIMTQIETEIKDDKIVEEIFLGVCCDGLHRREVIAEFGMSENDFDNGIRRLGTILNRIANKYKLKD